MILREGASLTFKFKEFQNEKDDNGGFFLPTFYCLGRYHMEVQVYANGNDMVRIHICHCMYTCWKENTMLAIVTV